MTSTLTMRSSGVGASADSGSKISANCVTIFSHKKPPAHKCHDAKLARRGPARLGTNCRVPMATLVACRGRNARHARGWDWGAPKRRPAAWPPGRGQWDVRRRGLAPRGWSAEKTRRSPRRHNRGFGPMARRAGCIPCRIARTVGGANNPDYPALSRQPCERTRLAVPCPATAPAEPCGRRETPGRLKGGGLRPSGSSHCSSPRVDSGLTG